ncbi:MAG: DEAD/DEAH box helicase [Firmicutes bacterium]|nr:DEAD/DEAH box helicase [Bacillota bacterium]
MFDIGQWAYDTVKGVRVQVIGKEDLWGYVSYQVYEPVSKMSYFINGDYLDKSPEENYSVSFVRYITALARIKNELAEGIFVKLDESILPLPHQVYALNRTLSGNNIRYLLADEVGLGKTIEAGLIIRELKARGLIKRVLIICPKGLVTQWYMEMLDKFHEKFNIVLSEDYDTIRRIYGTGNVYEAFDNVISPMDSIKPLEKRTGWDDEKIRQYNDERIYAIINSGWDLIIIDEAHRVAGSSSEVARYKMANLLAKASPYLLLLTATPHSGKTEPFLRLVRLLDEKAFPDYRAIVKEQVAPYVIRTEKREAIDYEGNRLFKDRITRVIGIKWSERHSLQKELYQRVTRYVANGYKKAIKQKKYHVGFLMVLMQRLVSSSTAAIRESIEKRIAVLKNQSSQLSQLTLQLSLEDLYEIDAETALENLLSTADFDIDSELNELEQILAVAKQAEHQFLDAKAEHLVDLLDKLYTEDNGRKVIIFTEFVATQIFLRDFLQRRGYSCSILNGSMSIDERSAVLTEFRTKTDLLISTDAGGEGLNLQFSNVVINYDLPWNPMKIEQRIGRVDRIGQSRNVFVYNYVLEDTVEKRVMEVLETKLSVILEQMGIDKIQDVLDSELAEVDFTDVYIKSIADPRYTDYYLDRLESDIKEQVAQAKKVRELMKDDKTFDVALISNIDKNNNVIDLLRRMYVNYKEWKNKSIENIDQLMIDLNHEEIKTLVNQVLHWDKSDGAVIINIPDLPNEKGYRSIWELSISSDVQDKRIIPVFVNTNGLSRPASANRIWDELLKPGRVIEVLGIKQLYDTDYEKIFNVAKDTAYNSFFMLKDRYEKRNQLAYEKYLFALQLRLEAAERIGIENIKRSRIESISREKEIIQTEYAYKRKLCPVLRPVFIAFME